jgi:hypothetical protein
LDKQHSISEADQTFEIIMTKLDPEVMSIFTRDVSSCTEDATEVNNSYTIF